VAPRPRSVSDSIVTKKKKKKKTYELLSSRPAAGGGSAVSGAVRGLLGGFGRIVNNARERTRAAVAGPAADAAPGVGRMEQGRAEAYQPQYQQPTPQYQQQHQYQQQQQQYQQQQHQPSNQYQPSSQANQHQQHQPNQQQPNQQQPGQRTGAGLIGAIVGGVGAAVGGAIASAARGGGRAAGGAGPRVARVAAYDRPLSNHMESICCDDCIGTCCNDCCDCVGWFVRGVASFFAAVLLLPFQIPIVVVGVVGAGIARAVPLVGTYYRATWDTRMIGPFLKGVLFVMIVPILAVGWALSIAFSPFVVWFAQAVAIAVADENFLSVGVDTVRQYWAWLADGLPGDLAAWGRSARSPPFDLNPFTFLFLIVFSLASSFAFVLPVTTVTAALAFLPSIARLVQASVAPRRGGHTRDPLRSSCVFCVLFGFVWFAIIYIYILPLIDKKKKKKKITPPPPPSLRHSLCADWRHRAPARRGVLAAVQLPLFRVGRVVERQPHQCDQVPGRGHQRVLGVFA
jgi:hypothetical protein